MATELEEADLTADDLGYIAQAQRIRAAMDHSAAIAAKQQQEAADRADREAAQMEAAQLIKNGATPQEVTRLLGHRLYKGATPRTQFEAMTFGAPPAPIPTGYVTNLPGMDRPMIAEPRPTGTIYKPVPTPPVVNPASQPPDVKQRLLEGNADLAAQRREIPKLKAAIESENDSDKKNILKGQLGDLMMGMDRQKDALRVASTNYPGYAPAKPASPTTEAAPKISTKSEFDALPKGAIYTGRDGRLYKKP